MANTIHLKLLENKTVAAFFNGMPISYEGGYRIVAGEQNSTDFVIDSVPSQYEGGTIDLYWKNEYNRNVEVTNAEKSFTLPNEMANFGYIQLKVVITKGDETAVWAPIKMKVWSTDIVTNIKTGAVTSVNGQTGDVTIDTSSAHIDVDNQLNTESENPVQNKVITGAINDVDDRLTKIEEQWEEMNYKAPTVTFSLTGDKDSVDLTTENLTRTITGFSHKETNVENIKGDLIFKRGGSILQSDIEKKDTSTQITLNQADTITFSGVQTYTYTLSGTSIKGVDFSSSASISSYYPAFYGAYAERPTDLSILTRTRSLSGTATITVEGAAQYIWFATTGNINKITSSGFDVPFEQDGDVLNYKSGSYKIYRTSEKIVAGTYSYIIS